MLGHCGAINHELASVFDAFWLNEKLSVCASEFRPHYRRPARRLEVYIELKNGTLKVGAPPDPQLGPVALFLKQVEKGPAATRRVRARGGGGGQSGP